MIPNESVSDENFSMLFWMLSPLYFWGAAFFAPFLPTGLVEAVLFVMFIPTVFFSMAGAFFGIPFGIIKILAWVKKQYVIIRSVDELNSSDIKKRTRAIHILVEESYNDMDSDLIEVLRESRYKNEVVTYLIGRRDSLPQSLYGEVGFHYEVMDSNYAEGSWATERVIDFGRYGNPEVERWSKLISIVGRNDIQQDQISQQQQSRHLSGGLGHKQGGGNGQQSRGRGRQEERWYRLQPGDHGPADPARRQRGAFASPVSAR